jgi:hypothetical protein
VFDDPSEGPAAASSGTSGSFLGSSVIRHNISAKKRWQPPNLGKLEDMLAIRRVASVFRACEV